MVKNSGKGGKGARKKASKNVDGGHKLLEFKEDDQEYAYISKTFGSCRFECICQDGKTRIGTLRGGMRKRVWLKIGDWVLVSLRDFQDSKCDILNKYSDSDVTQLKNLGDIVGDVETDITLGEDDLPSSGAADIVLGDDEIDEI